MVSKKEYEENQKKEKQNLSHFIEFTPEDRLRLFMLEQNQPEWQALHQPSPSRPYLVTASIIPNLFGLGFDSPKKQFDMAKGTYVKEVSEQTQILLDYGHLSEPRAIFFLKNYFASIANANQEKVYFVQPGLMVHPIFTFLAASSDGLLVRWKDFKMSLLNVEIKCPFYGSIPESINEIKPRVILQIQTQLACNKLKRSLLVYWSPKKVRMFVIPAHKDLQDLIEIVAHQFARDLRRGKEGEDKWKRVNKKSKEEALAMIEKVKEKIQEVDIGQRNEKSEGEK
jgi:hypothetical protein